MLAAEHGDGRSNHFTRTSRIGIIFGVGGLAEAVAEARKIEPERAESRSGERPCQLHVQPARPDMMGSARVGEEDERRLCWNAVSGLTQHGEDRIAAAELCDRLVHGVADART